MEQFAMEKNSDLVRIYDNETDAWKVVKRDKGFSKQLVTIEEMLSKFGLLKNEIKVYLYLARAGEKKAGEIAEAISLHRTETYRILRDLEKKGIIFSIFEKPLKFTAIPLDKAIDLLVDVQKVRIRLLEKEKPSLVNLWLSIPQSKIEKTKKELFQMLEGEQQVILKAEELLEKTEREFQLFAPDNYLSQLYYSDFTDKLKGKLNKIDVTLLTEKFPKSLYFMEQMNWPKENCRTVDASDHSDLPCFMISDKKELLIAFHDSDVANEIGDKKKFRTVALWTNYNAFISTLQMLFLKLLSTEKT
jgi:HTH-type transcriptional regulator, sugar sensing transcriptional regulator